MINMEAQNSIYEFLELFVVVENMAFLHLAHCFCMILAKSLRKKWKFQLKDHMNEPTKVFQEVLADQVTVQENSGLVSEEGSNWTL